MVITMLEARVEPENEKALMEAYTREAQTLDPGIVRTYLVRGAAERQVWRILTFWESKEVLEGMRSQGTPKGVLMFREASAEPSLSILEIVASGE